MRNPQPDSGPCWSRVVYDRVQFAHAPSSTPPTSSTPRTPASRLTQADASPTPFPTEPTLASSYPFSTTAATVPSSGPAAAAAAVAAPKSVLYLAYGSNLCAETFLGRRGIRPLSQINVSAPSLRLTFDLPGLPYTEPCFANTAPRRIPKLPDPPKLPPDLPPNLPRPPSSEQESEAAERRTAMQRGDPVWDKGLIGVVYEVTSEDFAKIVATEGGGASYADILVPCLPLPPRMTVPEKPGWPELPKMFVAHTLYAPRVPGKPGGGEDGDGDKAKGEDGDDDGNGGDDDGGDDDDKWKMPSWMRRLVQKLVLPVRRPEEDYAQPSARYLKLIRDGAREHELPDDYQRYLAELKPYTITTPRQRVGMVLLMVLFGPLFLLALSASSLFADEKGRAPRWLAVHMAVMLNVIWMSYDHVFKPLFGDGERTEEEEDHHAHRRRRGSMLRRASVVMDEEKSQLLADW